MGIASDIIGNAVNAYGSDDSSVTRTSLQTFLGKFGSSAGRYVDTIDPLGTFEVQFKFYPTLSLAEISNQQKPSKLGNALKSVYNSALDAGANALNNVTGGLFQNIVAGDPILEQRSKFEAAHKHTFMEYLAKANLMQTGEQWQDDQTAPLVLNLGPYVQSISIPNLKVNVSRVGNSRMGDFPVVSQPGVYPDGAMQMHIINTKAALHERIFYPWLREISLPYWSYDSQPYTTATITVDFSKHNDMQYVFVGCRPDSINSIQATQQPEATNLTRQVSFIYDAMFVKSKLKQMDSAGEKVMGAVGSILGGGGRMLNI